MSDGNPGAPGPGRGPRSAFEVEGGVFAATPFDRAEGTTHPPTRAYASWGRRVGAAVVDGVIVIFVTGLALLGGYLTESFVLAFVALLLWLVGFPVYSCVAMLRRGERRGQTLGKQVVAARVVPAHEGELTAATVIVREVLAKWLVFATLGGLFVLPLLLDFLWPLWDTEKAALHDKLASTRVVDAS